MPNQYPGMGNVYIPDHAATGHLVTQFSRNPKDFPLAKYCQYREIQKDRGYYLRLNVEQAGRMVGANWNEYVWPDGADAPRRNNGLDKHIFVEYIADRYAPDFTLGDYTVEFAGWDIKNQNVANLAQLAMTIRTRRLHVKLEDAASWDSTHIIDVATIPGNTGRWDQSTTARMDIKRSINYATEIIRKDTLATVKRKEDMKLVMNPFTARRIGECQEMIDAFKQSTEARVQWEGKYPDYTDMGIPPVLYGIEIVIEDTVMTTAVRGATVQTKQDCCADGVVYLLSRPGGLVSKVGTGPSFSTAMLFNLADMEVEVRHDQNNKRLDGRIVDFNAPEAVAPVSGFKFTNVAA